MFCKPKAQTCPTRDSRAFPCCSLFWNRQGVLPCDWQLQVCSVSCAVAAVRCDCMPASSGLSSDILEGDESSKSTQILPISDAFVNNGDWQTSFPFMQALETMEIGRQDSHLCKPWIEYTFHTPKHGSIALSRVESKLCLE